MANIKETLNGSKHFVPEHLKAGFSTTAIFAIALVLFGTNESTENATAHTQNEVSTAKQSNDRFIIIPAEKDTKKPKKKQRIPPPRITTPFSPLKPLEPETSQEITHEIIYTGEDRIEKYRYVRLFLPFI